MASVGTEFRTGEIAPVSGEYVYVRHIGDVRCTPTNEEREIQLHSGERFPPHRSCNAGVIWKLMRAH